jgi:DedD protein
LVLLGVIGFPLLFDSQPRPIAVDIAIEIPDKDQAKPLKAPPPRSKADVQADEPIAATTPVKTPATVAVSATRLSSGNVTASVVSKDAGTKPVVKSTAPVDAKPQAKSDPKLDTKVASKVADKAVQSGDAAKRAAMIEERDSDKQSAASAARFVVQVGAFADAAKAREVRLKLERAGLKTYTQVVEPKEGRRIRVRVGPFATKHDAEKAAEKIKKLDLPAGILEL